MLEQNVEGMRQLIAQSYDVLKEAVEAGRDSANNDALQRQAQLQEALDKVSARQDTEREKLRTEMEDEMQATRSEFEDAMQQLLSDHQASVEKFAGVEPTVEKRISDLAKELQVESAERQEAVQQQLEEARQTEEDEREKLQADLLEEQEAIRDELNDGLEKLRTQLAEEVGDSGAKYEDVVKTQEKLTAQLDNVEHQVLEMSEDASRSDSLEQRLEQLQATYDQDLQTLRNTDQELDRIVSDLSKKILGRSESDDAGGDESKGELQKAIDLLSEEVEKKLQASASHSEAKLLEMGDDFTKETSAVEKRLLEKIEQGQATASDVALLSEEAVQSRLIELEKTLASDREKHQAGVAQRTDELQKVVNLLDGKISALETKENEGAAGNIEDTVKQLDERLAAAEENVKTKASEEFVTTKDVERKQYVDDRAAKTEEVLREKITKDISASETNMRNFIGEQVAHHNDTLREYIDNKAQGDA